MTWWLWVILGFVLAGLELATPGAFYFLFFGAGAAVVGILVGLGLAGPTWMEWLLFSVVSVLSLAVFRGPLLARTRAQGSELVAEQYIGRFGELARTTNSVIVPANVADIGAMIATAMTVINRTPPPPAR